VKPLFPVILLAALSLAPGRGQGAESGVAAAWKRHDVQFVYMGFTTRYSCEGLRDKLRLLLRASGVRPDFKVTARSCDAGIGRVSAFPRVQIVFHSPEIPAPGSRDAGDPIVARWQKVAFSRSSPRGLEIGDCELVEQFRDRVLPALTTRTIASEINCIPHQLSGSSFRLSYEVLAGPANVD
jgi:hypothetical protein